MTRVSQLATSSTARGPAPALARASGASLPSPPTRSVRTILDRLSPTRFGNRFDMAEQEPAGAGVVLRLALRCGRARGSGRDDWIDGRSRVPRDASGCCVPRRQRRSTRGDGSWPESRRGRPADRPFWSSSRSGARVWGSDSLASLGLRCRSARRAVIDGPTWDVVGYRRRPRVPDWPPRKWVPRCFARSCSRCRRGVAASRWFRCGG